MRREIAEGCHVPGSADQGLKTPRWSAERRCRVPLFPGDPGDTPRLLPSCAFRRFHLPLSCRGRFIEPTNHAKGFAGGDDAWAEKERMNTRITGLTIMMAKAISTPPGTSGLLAFGLEKADDRIDTIER